MRKWRFSLRKAIPENQIASLRDELQGVRDTLTDTQDVTAAVVAATTAVAGLNNDSEATAVATARTAVNAAQTALANAANLAEADKTGLQAAIASLESTLSTIETVVAARPDPIVVAAITAAAKTKTTAIGVEAGEKGTDDEGLGGADVTTDHTTTVSRDRMATKVEIVVDGVVEDDPQFVKQDVDLGAETTMHIREMEADDDGNVEDQVVVVSTDIEEPTAKLFADVYPLNTNANTDDPPVNQSLTVETANVGMWSSSEFPSTPDTTREYPQDEVGTEGENEGAIDGKFDGADGTFVCVSSGCSIVTDEDGKLMTVNGTWRFTPDEKVTVDVDDPDYLTYGFWLARTKDADGDVKSYEEVETFAGSSVDESGNVGTVTGEATYKGGATGVYVKNVHNPDSTIASATSGLFTADAELTATFGQVNDDAGDGTIAPNLLNTISGTVSDLRNDADEVIDGGWTVNLMKGEIVANDGTFSGDATGDGSYSGTFHGSVAGVDHDMDSNTDEIIPTPSSVVGEFDANFSNGSVAGAFGAREE